MGHACGWHDRYISADLMSCCMEQNMVDKEPVCELFIQINEVKLCT